MGAGLVDSGPASPSGSPRLVRDAGLPPITMHGVRHSYASAALAAGEPLKVVSERLGHASTSITANLCQHVTPSPLLSIRCQRDQDSMRRRREVTRDLAAQWGCRRADATIGLRGLTASLAL